MGEDLNHRRISDSILLTIPMNVTADLGIVMKRCREKRLRKMKRYYPSLFPKDDADRDSMAGSDHSGAGRPPSQSQPQGGSSSSSDDKNTMSKKKDSKGDRDRDSDELIPRRNQYGSVLDYLEAKYVRGVVIPDLDAKMASSDGKDSDSESSGGARSCYSDASGFLDDSQLRTEVAEQVLASSSYGATKIEAERKKGDANEDAFFVNVGDLEMADGYDEDEARNIDFEEALKSKKKEKKIKKKRKREAQDQKSPKTKSPKTPKGQKKRDHSKSPKKRVKVTPAPAALTSEPLKSHHSDSSVSAPEKKKHPEKEKKHSEVDTKLAGLKQRCEELKQEQLKLYKAVKKEIGNMTEANLPRKEMIKVSVTIPMNKKPGDVITFSNPRVPGQKLRVKIPSSSTPGGKFIVSVPSSNPTNPNANNFSRQAKDVLDDYSRAYDEWIEAEARYREHIPGTVYKPNNERLKKFDNMVNEFPDNLAAPVDAAFLRKVVRRARQNSSKRRKTIEMQQGQGSTDNGAEKERNKEKKEMDKAPSQTLDLKVPGRGLVFGKVVFKKEHFTR